MLLCYGFVLCFFVLCVCLVAGSRDRNREHARYTRLRKKAFIGKLKDLQDEIKLASEAEDNERRVIAESISKLVSPTVVLHSPYNIHF